MKKSIPLIGYLFFFVNIIAFPQTNTFTKKLKRADCFFGVHFDLHASEDIMDAGKTLTAAMIDSFLAKVQPDFIQVDCKGHPGISSYPTKAGFHVKGFEKDPLKLFREITEQRNVALFVHFSGVWDGKVVKEHPDWAVVKANGQKSTEKTSFFSPYLDTYMIPQLKEISDYKIDGAWVDGECWAVEPDYGAASIKGFASETGITVIPKKFGDKYYPEFIEYTRSLFRKHLSKYINAIHQYNPAFEITSNWAYSSLMPEKVTTGVDFLSGDVTSQNGVYRSAFEARCLAPQGKPWDLMAWGFSWDGGKMPLNIKSSLQLEQEAAEIMAMGGGVQFYFQQNRDLSIKPWLAKPLAEISAFCRQRQQYVHKASAIAQIALLYPTASYQQNGTNPYANGTGMLQGALNVLLDGQQTVEVLMEHHLLGNMQQYPLIIIPECDYLLPGFKEALIAYSKQGGNLLIIGTATTKLFQQELGISSLTTGEEREKFIAASDKIGAIRSSFNLVALQPGAIATSYFYNGSDFTAKGKEIASVVNSLGKGKIAGVFFNAGSAYLNYKSPALRDFIAEQILEIFPNPLVKINGSHLVHATINRLNGKTMVNLINIAGEHTNQSAIGYDEIPSIKNLAVSIRTEKKPSQILLQPGEHNLEFEFSDGIAKLIVPELLIHSIIEITP